MLVRMSHTFKFRHHQIFQKLGLAGNIFRIYGSNVLVIPLTLPCTSVLRAVVYFNRFVCHDVNCRFNCFFLKYPLYR